MALGIIVVKYKEGFLSTKISLLYKCMRIRINNRSCDCMIGKTKEYYLRININHFIKLMILNYDIVNKLNFSLLNIKIKIN
mgnify:CR=1 FL=1